MKVHVNEIMQMPLKLKEEEEEEEREKERETVEGMSQLLGYSDVALDIPKY